MTAPLPQVIVGLVDQTHHICPCGNRRLTSYAHVNGANMLGCSQRGSFFSDSVGMLLNLEVVAEAPPYVAEALDTQRAFITEACQRLAAEGVGPEKIAVATDVPDLTQQPVILLNPRTVQADRRLQFDAIILPDMTDHVAFPAQALLALSQMLAVGGVLLFQARSASHPDLHETRMGASTVVRPFSQFYFLSRMCLELVFRGSPFRSLEVTEAEDHWLTGRAINGPRVLDVGMMSGIGDPLWSMVLAPALMAKHSVGKLRIFINDPGGHTGRRSNALLERFCFVEAVIPASFPIHPPGAFVDPKTGFLRYIPAGPVPAEDYSAAAPFTCRLVINGGLEQGIGFADIARRRAIALQNKARRRER